MDEPLLGKSPRSSVVFTREPSLFKIPENWPLLSASSSFQEGRFEPSSPRSPRTPRRYRPQASRKTCEPCSTGRIISRTSSSDALLRDDGDEGEEGYFVEKISPQKRAGTDSPDFGWQNGGSFKKKKVLCRATTCPVLHTGKGAVRNLPGRPEPESASSVVWQASMGLVIYLAIGVAIYAWKRKEFSGPETVALVDALYYCVVTMCTIGYGDIVPITYSAKAFACVLVLFGFGFLDALMSGLVTYVLNKQENLLLSAVEGGHHDTAKAYVMNTKKGKIRIRLKVALALATVIGSIAVGTIVMHRMERLSLMDAFYGTVMSVTTVGYGDHTFVTLKGRLFAAVWLLFSTLAVARAFVYLTEARVDKRHRKIAKWVMAREMTVGDLMAADLDHDGCISKSEFVIYKLKEMGKLLDKDIQDLCHQFDRLDVGHTGKLHLSRLDQEG